MEKHRETKIEYLTLDDVEYKVYYLVSYLESYETLEGHGFHKISTSYDHSYEILSIDDDYYFDKSLEEKLLNLLEQQ